LIVLEELGKAILYLKEQLEYEVAAREHAEKYHSHLPITFPSFNGLIEREKS
jgi:hypothetical protein